MHDILIIINCAQNISIKVCFSDKFDRKCEITQDKKEGYTDKSMEQAGHACEMISMNV